MITLILGVKCSLLVSSSSFLACIYYRNVFTITLFFGALVNAFIGKVLKKMLSVKRPIESLRSTNGMPSSHANSLSFFTFFLGLAALNLNLWIGALVFVCTTIYTLLICYCRVNRTKDHSWDQIAVGLIIGSMNGALSYAFILPICLDRFSSII